MASRTAFSLLEDMREMLLQMGKRLDDLEATINLDTFDFDDDEFSVTWSNGFMGFQKSGYLQYYALKKIYEAGEAGITHAELAEALYGNDVANVLWCVSRVEKKLRKYNCPLQIKHNAEKFWILKK